MKLSIIVPVYNVEKYIARCIDSLLSQNINFNDYEILIINDGSVDNSVKIVQDYCETYPNIFIHSQINSGVGAARNRGVDLAKGEYVYFIDSDDYLANNTLSHLINYSDVNKLDIVTFNSLVTTRSDLKFSNTENLHDLEVKIKTGIEYIGYKHYKNEIWWFIIKRDFLTATGVRFIKGRWMEDAIFTTQLFLKSSRIGHVNIDVHRHVVTPNSAMTSKEPVQYLRVIRDNANAAIVFNSIIEEINGQFLENQLCINRLKTRQQSFVFFMMVRILQSSIKLAEIRSILSQMESHEAYPLKVFIGKDYNRLIYKILVKIFNNKNLFYLLFIIVNPAYRFKRKIAI
ncbi:glycosyltransferase [uncultured Algibacter sp.]|uniref:glycosyltransferase n=1 Tax=uncultured Algibacter sp. TaxID=298659 RepID=UPI0026322906|nr:glycosyltransferase [uncultured Algibacter sp.]